MPLLELAEKDLARFWAKVALPNEQGCMLWLASCKPSGYGQFNIDGSMAFAHRISYTLAYGPIPDGMVLDHVRARGCTNRHCVAPLHLEAVTPGENTLRGDPGAWQRRKTHCKNGHLFDEANTYVRPHSGNRDCRPCKLGRIKAARERSRRDAAA